MRICVKAALVVNEFLNNINLKEVFFLQILPGIDHVAKFKVSETCAGFTGL